MAGEMLAQVVRCGKYIMTVKFTSAEAILDLLSWCPKLVIRDFKNEVNTKGQQRAGLSVLHAFQ